MTDPLQEQLSACLDGTLSEAELDLLIKRVERDADLAATLGRYALIGEALKAEKPVAASPKFAANVMAAITSEPASRRSIGLSPALARRLRPVAGLAVAAGVAAIAVFSVQRVGLAPEQVATSTAPSTSLVVTAPEDSYIVPTSTNTPATLVPATRLTNYVVAHSEYSSPLGRRSVLSGVLAEDEEIDEPQAADDDVSVTGASDGDNVDGSAQVR